MNLTSLLPPYTRLVWRLIIGGAILVVLLISGLWIRSCVNRRHAKIDEAAIQKINRANEQQRKEELRKVVVENEDVVKTVDNRTELQNLDIVTKTREIDQKVTEADKGIVEAKKQGKDITGPELECLLIPANCQP